MSNLVQAVGKIIRRQFEEAVKDGERTMKALAPYPTGALTGKGSYSTGETKRGIHTEKQGEFRAFVGVSNDHVRYAEEGRGAISKSTLMRWKDKRGRWHAAYSVAPMEGWHFVKRTAELMRAKYGG